MKGTNLILAYLTVFVGGYLLFKLKFFFIVHPKRLITRLNVAIRNRDNRRSLSLALAGTLGVGNIYGVALGIIIGGEGSVFWLFISSIFSLVIKYSESTLATYMSRDGNGMMSVFESNFKCKSVANLYAVMICLLACTMGAFIQSDSFISSATYIFNLPKNLIAAILLLIVALVAFGGSEKIKNATEIIIPLATLAYILISVIAISSNSHNIIPAIYRIFKSAMSGRSLFGGMVPVFNSVAFSEGFARGILSNEAGVGTSSIAHSDGKRTPVTAGIFGMCEIVFDTLILCMLTAFLILTSIPSVADYSSPMRLIFDAVRIGTGEAFLPLLFISIFFFAYSTIICWYSYGRKALAYLGEERLSLIFSFLFYFSIILASFLDSLIIIYINDFLIFLMSVPTLFSLIKGTEKICSLTKNEGIL